MKMVTDRELGQESNSALINSRNFAHNIESSQLLWNEIVGLTHESSGELWHNWYVVVFAINRQNLFLPNSNSDVDPP